MFKEIQTVQHIVNCNELENEPWVEIQLETKGSDLEM